MTAAPDIIERTFVSPWDGSSQTFLERDFRTDGKGDLAFIFLHGAASHQDQGMTLGIYENAFGRLAKELERRQALYICPEYRGGSWMGPAAEADVREILRGLQASGFEGKVILAGGSMGGTSALIFAARHPKLLNGVLAMCPATDVALMFDKFPEQFRVSYGGTPKEVPDVYAERRSRDFVSTLACLPIFLIHGAKDTIIEVEHSRILAAKLQEQEACFRYIEMPEGDHDAPVAYSWCKILDWLLPTEQHP